jgi:hypothetical protein
MVRLAGVEPEIYGLVTETLGFSILHNLRKLLEKRFLIVFMNTLASPKKKWGLRLTRTYEE